MSTKPTLAEEDEGACMEAAIAAVQAKVSMLKESIQSCDALLASGLSQQDIATVFAYAVLGTLVSDRPHWNAFLQEALQEEIARKGSAKWQSLSQ